MGETSKVSLKLLIDKKSNKVVFAEAGKDFVDFLFNLLALPIGTVIKLLKPSVMDGCIGNLYDSLENFNEGYLQPHQSKDSLLMPALPLQLGHHLRLLLPDTNGPKFYSCSSNYHRGVTDQRGAPCSDCKNSMISEVPFVGWTNNSSSSSDEGASASDNTKGGCVKGLVTYMVTDDLSVTPLSLISGVALLNKLSVKGGFSSLEEKVVEFGTDEGLELLKAALKSKAALTMVFIAKHEVTITDAAAP